jgi:cell wall assembly regulator SMI1
VQKFTRPITREIELGGGRLALTLSEQGIAVRPVGSRKPPREISWAQLVCQLTGATGAPEPSPADLAAAVESLKKGEGAKASATAARTTATTNGHADERPAAAAPTEAASEGVPALLSRLEKWLHQHRRRYVEGLQPGASAGELDATQAALGAPLSQELRTLLSWHNGQSGDFIGHLENNWDLMSAGRIVEAKREMDGGDRAQTGWQPAWVPFLEDDAGNYLVLDTSQTPSPVREMWQGNPDHAVAASSLATWLEKFISAVEQGRYHEDPERGTFLATRS